MAQSDKVKLYAQAKKAGVKDYRKMDLDELRVAIENAQGRDDSRNAEFDAGATNGKTKGKGKTAAKTAPTKTKGKTATATPTKGKTSTRKSAPAKSAPGKSAAKSAAPKGAQAKRPTTGGKTKTAAAKPAVKRGAKVESHRALLDNAKIDWTVESNVGTTGKRGKVLDCLREHKGDKAVVFKKLKRYATKWYPQKTEHEAHKMLVWLIGRVAYDFAYKSGQHEQGQRAAYGTSTTPLNVKRREARASAQAPARKRAGARTAPSKGKAKTAAAKGKQATPRGKGKTAARGKSKS
jgi:hypothetical protein